MEQQLTLALEPAVAAMSAEPPTSLPFPRVTEGGTPFDDEGRFFEPWWPGAPAFLRRVGDRLVLRTQHLGDALETFPEIRGVLPYLSADGLIVEGTLLALDAAGRPDARLLRRHLGAAGRPEEFAEGAFVAADLPWLEGRSLQAETFAERRRQLTQVLTDSEHCVLGRGVVGEGRMLGRAVAALGLAAISAHRLDSHWAGNAGNDDRLRLTVEDPQAGPTRPFLVLMERLPLPD